MAASAPTDLTGEVMLDLMVRLWEEQSRSISGSGGHAGWDLQPQNTLPITMGKRSVHSPASAPCCHQAGARAWPPTGGPWLPGSWRCPRLSAAFSSCGCVMAQPLPFGSPHRATRGGKEGGV